MIRGVREPRFDCTEFAILPCCVMLEFDLFCVQILKHIVTYYEQVTSSVDRT